MRCTTLTTLLTGVMLYLGMGALVFVTLEAPKESEAHENLLKAKEVFLNNKSCVSEVDFHELVKVSSDKHSPSHQHDPISLTDWNLPYQMYYTLIEFLQRGFFSESKLGD